MNKRTTEYPPQAGRPTWGPRFHRRRFIRGVGGVVVGLPALEAFLPRRAHAQADNKIYTVFMQQQNGSIQGTSGDPQLFWPSSTGALSAATMMGADADKATSELRDHAAKLLMIRGINFPFGNPVGCGHSSGCNQTITAARMKGRSNRSTPVSESADVALARRVTPGRDPLTLYAGRKAGYLDDAFSYGSGGSVRAGENNPWNAFQRMTGLDALSMQDPAQFEKIAARRKSINDLLRSQIKTLMDRPDIGKGDRDRLDVHFNAIRELERGMEGSLGPMPAGDLMGKLQAANGTHTQNDKMEEVVRLQLELIAFAFASDRVRVATLQVGEGNDHTRYIINGQQSPPYHFISHRVLSDGGSGTRIGNAVELHHQIDRIHARFFKHLLDKLEGYKLPDGSALLDNTAAVWLNSNANGPPHSVRNVPHLVAGGAGGFLKVGQYVDGGNVNNNKFLNTIITAAIGGRSVAAPVEDFGDPGLDKGLLPPMLA